RDRSAAQIERAQLFQRRESGESEIGDASAARDPALGFAVGGSEIVGPRPAERYAESHVPLFETAEERDRVELEVGDARRPAPAGVAALNAVEAEFFQLRQQLQDMQTGAADLVAAEVQLFELGERCEMFEPDVGDLGERDVERLQLRQLGDV